MTEIHGSLGSTTSAPGNPVWNSNSGAECNDWNTDRIRSHRVVREPTRAGVYDLVLAQLGPRRLGANCHMSDREGLS